jgi:hypothetical protein
LGEGASEPAGEELELSGADVDAHHSDGGLAHHLET